MLYKGSVSIADAANKDGTMRTKTVLRFNTLALNKAQHARQVVAYGSKLRRREAIATLEVEHETMGNSRRQVTTLPFYAKVPLPLYDI